MENRKRDTLIINFFHPCEKVKKGLGKNEDGDERKYLYIS